MSTVTSSTQASQPVFYCEKCCCICDIFSCLWDLIKEIFHTLSCNYFRGPSRQLEGRVSTTSTSDAQPIIPVELPPLDTAGHAAALEQNRGPNGLYGLNMRQLDLSGGTDAPFRTLGCVQKTSFEIGVYGPGYPCTDVHLRVRLPCQSLRAFPQEIQARLRSPARISLL